jgi:glycosyltransferase involved in cell wall biosynthesis
VSPTSVEAPATEPTVAEPAGANSLRVLLATIEPLKGHTGVETHSRALSAGLNDAGYQCAVQTPLVASRRWGPVFAIRPLLLRKLNPTWSTRWLRHWHGLALRGGLTRTLSRGQTDALICQCPVSAEAAMSARRHLGLEIPVLMVCHFNYSEATEYRNKGELASQVHFDAILETERRVLETVDHVVYVSNWARQTVEEERGIRPRASSVIWNGIPAQTTIPPIQRSEIGLGPDDLVLITVGTLEPRKNQIALIELVAKLAPRFPNIRLLLIGDGPDRRRIEARIDGLNLRPYVRLLGFRTDVARLLPVSDIYVHASLLENCPIVILEAARAGRPVAAIPAGGVPELFDVLGGTPLDPRDTASLIPLLCSPAARAQAGRVAQEVFEGHFTAESMVARYINVLQATVAQRGGRTPP